MKSKPTFIVIDDDYINNELCSMIIENSYPKAIIEMFTDPEAAIAFIESNYSGTKAHDTILLLDINMPTLTGWEFLDAFDTFDSKVKKQFYIYMVSSSVDPRDKERANASKNVVGYTEKPIDEEFVKIAVENLWQ